MIQRSDQVSPIFAPRRSEVRPHRGMQRAERMVYDVVREHGCVCVRGAEVQAVGISATEVGFGQVCVLRSSDSRWAIGPHVGPLGTVLGYQAIFAASDPFLAMLAHFGVMLGPY